MQAFHLAKRDDPDAVRLCTGQLGVTTTRRRQQTRVGTASGSLSRLITLTDPSETLQAVGDTPETDRANASRGF
jgi:hypothetical protein